MARNNAEALIFVKVVKIPTYLKILITKCWLNTTKVALPLIIRLF